jgi:hypothetical protein
VAILPILLNRFGHVLAPPTLALVPRHGGDVARIPYERTGVASCRSIWFHDASQVSALLEGLLGRPDGGTMFDAWYRENETLQQTVDDAARDGTLVFRRGRPVVAPRAPPRRRG